MTPAPALSFVSLSYFCTIFLYRSLLSLPPRSKKKRAQMSFFFFHTLSLVHQRHTRAPSPSLLRRALSTIATENRRGRGQRACALFSLFFKKKRSPRIWVWVWAPRAKKRGEDMCKVAAEQKAWRMLSGTRHPLQARRTSFEQQRTGSGMKWAEKKRDMTIKRKADAKGRFFFLGAHRSEFVSGPLSPIET